MVIQGARKHLREEDWLFWVPTKEKCTCSTRFGGWSCRLIEFCRRKPILWEPLPFGAHTYRHLQRYRSVEQEVIVSSTAWNHKAEQASIRFMYPDNSCAVPQTVTSRIRVFSPIFSNCHTRNYELSNSSFTDSLLFATVRCSKNTPPSIWGSAFSIKWSVEDIKIFLPHDSFDQCGCLHARHPAHIGASSIVQNLIHRLTWSLITCFTSSTPITPWLIPLLDDIIYEKISCRLDVSYSGVFLLWP